MASAVAQGQACLFAENSLVRFSDTANMDHVKYEGIRRSQSPESEMSIQQISSVAPWYATSKAVMEIIFEPRDNVPPSSATFPGVRHSSCK